MDDGHKKPPEKKPEDEILYIYIYLKKNTMDLDLTICLCFLKFDVIGGFMLMCQWNFDFI